MTALRRWTGDTLLTVRWCVVHNRKRRWRGLDVFRLKLMILLSASPALLVFGTSEPCLPKQHLRCARRVVYYRTRAGFHQRQSRRLRRLSERFTIGTRATKVVLRATA